MYLILILLRFLPAYPSQPSYFAKLEADYSSGKITLKQKLDYTEYALINPKALPQEEQRYLSEHPLNLKCGTPKMMEVYRERRKLFKEKVSTYNFPDEMQFYIDSETYPIRVEYDTESDADLARAVLESAEYSWKVETEDYGFKVPPIVTPENRYRIYVGDAGAGAAGVTVPIGEYPDTSWQDCVTYIVIERTNYPDYVNTTVAHELNHAMQAATDCSEPLAFWENTSTFIELEVYPESIYFNNSVLYSFQENSFLSISSWKSGDAYQYGGFIWPYFLAHYYGPQDQPASFIKDIWENTMEETGAAETTNYLESIDDLLKSSSRGSLDEAFHLFSMSRYFLYEQTDPVYSLIYDSEQFDSNPMIMKSFWGEEYGTYTLPDSYKVLPYGVVYFRFKLPYDSENLRPGKITVTQWTTDDPWYMQIFPSKHTSLEDVKTATLQNGQASIEFNPAETGEVILAVEHLGGENFNPYYPGSGEKFTLTYEPATPLPELNYITPGTIFKNEEAVLTLYGNYLQEGAQVEFTPSKGIEITNYDYSENKILLTILTTDKVLSGEYEITVKNPDNGKASLKTELNFIVHEEETHTGGGGCSSNPSGSSDLPVFMLLAFMTTLFIRKNNQ